MLKFVLMLCVIFMCEKFLVFINYKVLLNYGNVKNERIFIWIVLFVELINV